MAPVEEERWERIDREPVTRDPVAPPPNAPVNSVQKSEYYRSSGPAPYDPRYERVVWFVDAVVCALIAIRFFMKLLGASYGADFVRFIYGVTGPLVAPFRGIFQPSGSGNYVLEPESLIAIAIYVLIGWGLVALIRILSAPRTRPVV